MEFKNSSAGKRGGNMNIIVNNTILSLVKGDITKQNTEAIVNAANSGLLGGGGVDGAIHRAGGPKILAECEEIRARQGGCLTGEAVITSGGKLPARYVIHTVGPIWKGGSRNEPQLLSNCYLNSLQLAADNDIKTVAFPSISTGVYGYPVEKAAGTALTAIIEFISNNNSFREVKMVLFSDANYEKYKTVLYGLSE